MDVSALTTRAEKLLLRAAQPITDDQGFPLVNEVYQGTITLMQSLYGPNSRQERALHDGVRNARERLGAAPGFQMGWAVAAVRGALSNIVDELRTGLVGTLQQAVAGDVLGDFVRLARHVLDRQGEAGKNVASVLVAAAYEDTIRRMGAAFAGVIERDDLQDVIQALKQASVLVAPQLPIALSYLSFRNHALHAEWDKIDTAAVHSVLGFVEQLLIKHFG